MMININIYASEITTYAYIELTKQSTQQKVQDLNQIIGAISSFASEPELWITEEAQMNAVFDSRLEALYESYGITADQYLLYYSKNMDEIESYLDVHQDDKQVIEQLNTEVASLLNQYEQLKMDLLQLEQPETEDPLPVEVP
jgi:hypothetical protein